MKVAISNKNRNVATIMRIKYKTRYKAKMDKKYTTKCIMAV